MAKQKVSTSAAAQFEPVLLDASRDTALSALAQAGAAAPELIEAWTRRGNAAAVSEAADRATGAARKAARRAINVLRARGVSIPERGRTVVLARSTPEEVVEALLLPPDAMGSIVVAITKGAPTRRHRVAMVYLHDTMGLHRIQTGELSQSQLKETLAQIGNNQRPIKVPVPWARHRVAQARKRHQERGVPEPLGLASASELLEPVPEAPPEHPFDGEGLELSDDDARDLSVNCIKLHELSEFRSWMPSKEAVDEMIAKVGEIVVPGEEPDPNQLRERLEQEVRAATDRYFSPQRRDDLVRLMKDCALSVLQREGEVRALEVVATMKVVQNAGLITDPPHQVGFLRGFFEKALSLLLMRGGGKLSIPALGRKAAPEETDEPEQAAATEPEAATQEAAPSEPAPTEPDQSGAASE
jgi:hypothetical protein